MHLLKVELKLDSARKLTIANFGSKRRFYLRLRRRVVVGLPCYSSRSRLRTSPAPGPSANNRKEPLESEWLAAKDAIYWIARRIGTSATAACDLINDRLSSGVIKSRERRWREGDGLVDEAKEPRPVDPTRWIASALRPDGMITSRAIAAGIPVGKTTFPLIEVCFADLTGVWPTAAPDTTNCTSTPDRGPSRRPFPRGRFGELVKFVRGYYAIPDPEGPQHNQKKAWEKAEAHFNLSIPRKTLREACKTAEARGRPGRPRRNYAEK
jgi:hypothetical protein